MLRPQDWHEQAIAEYAAGDTLQAIGRRHNKHYTTILRVVNPESYNRAIERQRERRRKPGGRRVSQAERVRKMYDDGLTREEIEARTGLTRNTIGRMINGSYKRHMQQNCLRAKRKTEVNRKYERFTERATLRGCIVTVTADTADEAQALLRRMAHA